MNVSTVGQPERASQHERLNAILELLSARGRLSVQDAADAFKVSGATIRRDFDHLGEQQLLRRTRGGAVALLGYDLPLGYRVQGGLDVKQRIGQTAASLLGRDEVVGLSAGPTAIEVARAIGARPELAESAAGETVTVVTNALNAAYELAIRPGVAVLTPGGRLRQRSYALVGGHSVRFMESVRLRHVIIDAAGVDPVAGVTVADSDEAEVCAMMVRRARRVIAVAEGDRLGQESLAVVCSAEELDVLVTDDRAPLPVLESLRALGVEVVTV